MATEQVQLEYREQMMQLQQLAQQAAVGTTVALLERGSRVMSAIHKRLYSALKNEFKLLAKVFATYLPPEYPYDVVGGQKNVKVTDFDDKVDVLPVADPNIFSMSQRISLAQTGLQLAMSNPQIHNSYMAFRKMYESLGIKDIDRILPPPPPKAPKDPSLEHIDALGGKQFQAFPGQDHRAHVTAHLNFMSTNLVRHNPPVMASIQKHILEHISLMATEQVQLEYREQMMQLQQLAQQAAVGTTVALLERGSRVMSAIHKRLYAALKNEFKLLAKVFATYLPPEYPYDVVGGQKNVKVTDFDDKVDVLPVADPNIFSMSQRISLAQTGLQLAMSNPQIHNSYMAFRKMYELCICGFDIASCNPV
jgi:hypothetical protein